MKANGHNTFRVICDVCGFKFNSDQVIKRWDNLIVCHKDWETRHWQDFIKVPPENVAPPFVRPEPADTFVSVTYLPSECDVLGRRGIAQYAIAGCAISGDGF